jgi:Xaa-Pro aminopeptidase
LTARRARVAEALGPDSLLILWSAPHKTYSHDIEYEFRQDSNFYYLTGIDQPGAILVLMPGNASRKEILFIEPRDPVREHWEGRRLSKEEAAAQSGIATVYLSEELEPFVQSILSRRPYDVPRYKASREYDVFFKALAAGRAKLALILQPRPELWKPLGPTQEFAKRVKERYEGFSVQDASEVLGGLRQVKTAYERKTLERSAEISSQAQRAAMQAARPGVFEYEVEAVLEQVYKASGALGPSYPSIVGSGPNATIPHYWRSTRRLEPGDLLLVDAAANYEYQTVDITRTYPVGGSFTAEQKDIYRIVLAALEAAIPLARAGARLDEIHLKTVEVVRQGLLKLGLITDASGDQYRTWYTHGACHWIGMDVHDVGDRQRPLEPGMAFVIEPGIYIRPEALDSLPRSPENDAFIAKVRPAVEKYKNIGVRIEDSFLLTEEGLKNLSGGVPRTIEEIERFLKARPTSSGTR